jgi:ribosomal protein S16
MHKFNSFKFIIVFLIVCMTISSSESNKYNESHRRMVGGYSPVETNDPQVILASELVLRNLTQGKGPIEKYSFLLTSQSEDSQHFQVKVVEASQQVSVCVLVGNPSFVRMIDAHTFVL